MLDGLKSFKILKLPCKTLVYLGLIGVWLLSACTLRAAQPAGQPTEDIVATIVAATLTSMAQPEMMTPTPEPIMPATMTPMPEAWTPTSTALPTNTPSPTETLTPTLTSTPTAIEKDIEIPTGSPTWIDTFESGKNWYLYADDHVRFEAKDGRVLMTALKAESWDGFMLTYPDLANFYLQATFITGQICEGLDRYGVVFRASKHEDLYVKYYLYGFSCDGRYWLRSFNVGKVDNLIPWTSSEWILRGPQQTNQLGVLAQGERLVLFANGKRLAEIKDASHTMGKFGLFIGALENENFQVSVDEIAYWEIP